jgi:4'-phosphopantetheinyl transferase
MESIMEIYWFEQIAADVPAGEDWLSATEADHLHKLRFAKRRADWLLGRWTAKNAVAMFLGIPREPLTLHSVEIRPDSSGAPKVFLENASAEVAISLSHRSGVGMCAVAPAGVSLGCDLETIEPHGDAFPVDYFTAEEQALVTRAPTILESLRSVTLLWSAKESALKALGEGLRLDTRSVVVRLPEPFETPVECRHNFLPTSVFRNPSLPRDVNWRPLQVHYGQNVIFRGWWSQSAFFLRTLVSLPAVEPPILLHPDLRVSVPL